MLLMKFCLQTSPWIGLRGCQRATCPISWGDHDGASHSSALYWRRRYWYWCVRAWDGCQEDWQWGRISSIITLICWTNCSLLIATSTTNLSNPIKCAMQYSKSRNARIGKSHPLSFFNVHMFCGWNYCGTLHGLKDLTLTIWYSLVCMRKHPSEFTRKHECK